MGVSFILMQNGQQKQQQEHKCICISQSVFEFVFVMEKESEKGNFGHFTKQHEETTARKTETADRKTRQQYKRKGERDIHAHSYLYVQYTCSRI